MPNEIILSYISRLKKSFQFRSRMAVYMGNSTILTETIHGHKMFLDSRDISVTPAIVLDGKYEVWVTQTLMSHVRRGMTVVEVGANVGFYTVLISDKISSSGHYYAFEANPHTYSLLHKNIDINSLMDRVVPENIAVYDRITDLTFTTFASHQGNGSVVNFSRDYISSQNDNVTKITVPATSLDVYFKNREQTLDLVKIDAEGSEPFIIDGMKNILAENKHLIIFCEFAPHLIRSNNRSPEAFLKILRNYGYKVYAVRPFGRIVEYPDTFLLQQSYVELLFKR